jgi:hypothetical protein
LNPELIDATFIAALSANTASIAAIAMTQTVLCVSVSTLLPYYAIPVVAFHRTRAF